MRLPAFQIPDLDQIEEMRPRKGDIVTHREDEELYIVDEVGMRYLVCHQQGNTKAQRWFKHHEVYKWTPADDQPAHRDLTQIFVGIGPRD
jgi:hypothetical protein